MKKKLALVLQFLQSFPIIPNTIYLILDFFENLAFESKIEAEKTLMIKTSIHHRKSCVRRAHTLRYDAARKRKYKARGLYCKV